MAKTDLTSMFPEARTDYQWEISYGLPPFSLRVKDAAAHFGIKANTLYQWINDGILIRGKHYLKVGKVVCIIREDFIDFMRERDARGC